MQKKDRNLSILLEPNVPRTIHLKRRTISRLAAIQALYQMSFNDETADKIIGQFLQRGREEEFVPKAEAIDVELFSNLVLGVEKSKENIDKIIVKSLPEGWPFDRLDPVIVMLLRCGSYEFFNFPDTPTPVIISEYLDIAHAFYDGKEVGFINGILNNLVQTIRE